MFKGDNFDIKGARIVGDGQGLNPWLPPQDLTLDTKGQISGQVTLIERLGTETVVELVTSDHITLRYAMATEADLPWAIALLKIDPKRLIFFAEAFSKFLAS